MEFARPIASFAIAGVLAFPQFQTVQAQQVTPAPKNTVASTTLPTSTTTPVPTSSLTSKAWDVLKEGVADKSVVHRKSAIATIGTIKGSPEALKMVEGALQDKDQDVRQTAAVTLGEMKDKQAIPYLKAAMDDTPAVSFSAAKALWDLGDTSGRDMFQQVIEGQRTNAPGKLHGAIAEGKKKLTPGQMTLMGAKDAVGAVFGPAGLGIDAIQEAVKTAKNDTGAPGRTVAAEVLGKDSDPYALILLEWALGDDNWSVRVAVAKALGERGNEATIAKLEPQLSDDHHQVRYMAAASMIRLSLKSEHSPND